MEEKGLTADCMTVAQVAEGLGLDVARIYKLLRSREIPCIEIGASKYIPRKVYEAYVERLMSPIDQFFNNDKGSK